MNPIRDHTNAGPLTVGTRPVTLHVPVGAAIFALRGEAWITQEGLLDDIVVSPGRRFVVPGDGALVVSATHATVELMIVRPALAKAHPAADIYDFARAYAAQLRREAIARAGSATVAALRSLLARARTSLASRPRMPA